MSGENQHWVPKFLIKNFADADGRVFSLDRVHRIARSCGTSPIWRLRPRGEYQRVHQAVGTRGFSGRPCRTPRGDTPKHSPRGAGLR